MTSSSNRMVPLATQHAKQLQTKISGHIISYSGDQQRTARIRFKKVYMKCEPSSEIRELKDEMK